MIDYERRDYERLREEFGKLEEENRQHLEYIGKLEGMIDELEQRVEVVRCRDCKWFTPEYFYEEERGYGVVEILSDPPDCGNPERCSHHYDSLTKKTVPVHIVTDPDGFCAWAERRDA